MPHFSKFARQIEVPEIGLKGQKALMKSSVLVVGVGGLGCPASLYLAAVGIGVIGLADGDVLSLSNLQRQILFCEKDIGKKKVEIAERRLKSLSPLCDIKKYPYNINQDNVEDTITPYDVIIDCTDSLESRFIINSACYDQKKKLISASLHHHDGQVAAFNFSDDAQPCYECLYPKTIDQEKIPSCKEGGIVGPVAGIIGSMQAIAAVNEILGIRNSLSGSVFMFSSLTFNSQLVKVRKSAACQTCSKSARNEVNFVHSCNSR